MNKILKTILISSIVVFGVCLIFTETVHAQTSDFVVEFEKGPSLPLFSEANFLPGDSVSRWIKVTNNSTGIFKIATKADNWIDNDGLSNVLNLEIKQGGASLYNKKLSDFFSDGEVFLSDLAGNGTQTQYDYIISFNSGAGDIYQGKSLKFDILIGYQGLAPSGGTYTFVGGGGYPGQYVIATTTIPSQVAGAATEQTTTTLPGEGEGGEVLGESTTTPTSTETETPSSETTEEVETTGTQGTQEAGAQPSQNWLWILIGVIVIGGVVYFIFLRKK